MVENEENVNENKVIFVEYKQANIFERMRHNIAKIIRNIFKTKES